MIEKKEIDYTYALKSFLSLLVSTIPYLGIKIMVSDFEKLKSTEFIMLLMHI